MKHTISWKKYIQKRASEPPRPLLLDAIKILNCPKIMAIDLGSGTMNDVRFLLTHFENVTAIDSDKYAKEKALEIQNKNLKFVFDDIERVVFPDCDLVNAQYILPYIENIEALIEKIHTSLR